MMQNTTAVVFRRTSTQLRQNGGIWQEATAIFKQFFGKNVVIRSRDLEIHIPSTNATIKFSHLQHLTDVNSHLGAQYSCVVFDEATLFEFETMILPLLGRLRNARVDYKPQMFWATNPMYDHGVYHWIKDFYLDEFGIPLKEKSNVERYFVLQNGKPLWYDSLEEAETNHGKGIPRSFRSIKAHVTDNIPLIKANPDYLSNLMALPDIKRRIYLDGSWIAREEEAGLYHRAWSTIVEAPNMKAKKRVLAFDLASQPVSTQSPNPDWTRGLVMSRDENGIYTIEHLVSVRDRPHVVEELIYKTAREFPNILVTIPIDPGAAGAAHSSNIKRKLGEQGINCKLIRPLKSKRIRFLPFSSIAEAGFVNVVRADWNEELFNELEEFTGLRRGERDDICDVCSDAVSALNMNNDLPSFTLPDFTGTNPFDGSISGNNIPSYNGVTIG
jgi:predicted phage terminase large subunit-like protein